MAQDHNALKYGVTIGRALSRLTGLGDLEDGTGRLGETLQPCVDPWSRPEWAALRGEWGYARKASSAAVAARFSTIELTLATTTTRFAVVRLQNAFTSVIQAQIDSGGAVAANPLTSRGLPLDDRSPQIGETSQILITTGDTAAGANLPQVEFASQVSPQPEGKYCWWVLVPGSRLFIAGIVVNTAIAANFFWYEKELFPGERSVRS